MEKNPYAKPKLDGHKVVVAQFSGLLADAITGGFCRVTKRSPGPSQIFPGAWVGLGIESKNEYSQSSSVKPMSVVQQLARPYRLSLEPQERTSVEGGQ